MSGYECVFSKENLQSRFTALKAQIEQIEGSSPRIERDALYSQLSPKQLDQYDARIAKHEKDLFAIKQEYALLARALGARSMR